LEDGEHYIIRGFIICSSAFLIKIVLSRRMKWVGYVAREGKQRHEYKFSVGKTEGSHCGDVIMSERIVILDVKA
jgi:hypothetical protein